MNSSRNISKISIVISVMNGAKTLERCLLSSFNQTYESKEIIVIDGLSTDGTIHILEKYSEKIDYWVSEPDTGIYSAWNKALKKASGDWICFLGCDDWWCSSTSLSALVECAHYPDLNFVSGKVYLVNNRDTVIRSIGRPLNVRRLHHGMGIAHPGALHHRSLFETHGLFDESYKIAGDYEFFLRSCSSTKSSFLPQHVVYMGSNGLSQASWRLTVRESCRALTTSKGYGVLAAIQFHLLSYLSRLKSTVAVRLKLRKAN